MPGCHILTDSGVRGTGYTGTHAQLPVDKLIASCITDVYGPLLLGENPCEVNVLHRKLLHDPPTHWVGRAGITQMALSAIDLALWDLKAKAAGEPLWHLLGGQPEKKVEA